VYSFHPSFKSPKHYGIVTYFELLQKKYQKLKEEFTIIQAAQFE